VWDEAVDLDVLVGAAVVAGEREARARGELVRAARNWSVGEDDFLRKNLGWLTDEEIGAQLGRSEIAVHLRWSRDLGLESPSKAAGWVTALGVARLLGVDGHKVTAWIDRGLLRGHRMAGGRLIRRVRQVDLDLFVINPGNWVWFDPEGIQDARLRRLALARRVRWGDAWWDTQQAAAYCGYKNSKSVVMAIRRGCLGGVQAENQGGRHAEPGWANWYVLRSEVERWQAERMHGEDNLNRILLTGLAVGLSAVEVARLTGGRLGRSGIPMRVEALWRASTGSAGSPTIAGGEVGRLLAGTAVQWRESDRQVFVDWRALPGRFRRLEGALGRVLTHLTPGPSPLAERGAGGQASREDWYLVREVVRRWLRWYGGADAARMMVGGGRGVEMVVRRGVAALRGMGINMLGEGTETGTVGDGLLPPGITIRKKRPTEITLKLTKRAE